MASLSAEERTALQDAVRRLLADHSAEAQVRATMDTPAGYDASLWARLAEMGVVGLMVDEAYGGAGAGPLELEIVMEEAGAALLCSPLLASGVVAAELLRALGDAEVNARLLPGIAAGTTIATVALTGEAGAWTPEAVAVKASATGEGWGLDGAASYVLHGQNADILLVLATGLDGLAVFEVDPKATGVTVEALPTFDHTTRLARITFDGVHATKLQPAARNAAQRLADDAPDKAAAISLAAFACADAFVTTTATSIQMHGGIAFTWVHPAHLYLRRARADAQLFGTPAYHRERYIQQLGG